MLLKSRSPKPLATCAEKAAVAVAPSGVGRFGQRTFAPTGSMLTTKSTLRAADMLSP